MQYLFFSIAMSLMRIKDFGNIPCWKRICTSYTLPGGKGYMYSNPGRSSGEFLFLEVIYYCCCYILDSWIIALFPSFWDCPGTLWSLLTDLLLFSSAWGAHIPFDKPSPNAPYKHYGGFVFSRVDLFSFNWCLTSNGWSYKGCWCSEN